MSLSAAHASTPCGAPAITSSVVSTPAARSRCAYATSSSWNTRRPRCTATRAAARRGPRGGRRLRSAARRRSRRLGPDRERHPTRLERLVQMRWASASRVRSRAVRSSSMGQNSHCAATPTPSCASGTGADRVPSRTLRLSGCSRMVANHPIRPCESRRATSRGDGPSVGGLRASHRR